MSKLMTEIIERQSKYVPMCENTPFTALEWEILQHRLEVPYALTECMTDSYWSEECGLEYDEMKELMGECMDEMLSFETMVNVKNINCWERIILKDCVEGSVYMVDEMAELDVEEEYGRGAVTSIKRAKNSIELKTGWVFP